MDKNSFLIYLDYEEQFNLLTDEQIGKLMRAIMKYEKTKEEPTFDDNMLLMAFSFIKKQLDRDEEKWLEEKKKRSEAGKKGMAKRWGNDNKVITENNNDNDDINAITNITDNVDVDVNVNVDDNDSSSSIKFYMENINPLISPHEVELLNDYCNSLSDEMVIYAIKDAIEHNAKNMKYIKSILDRYVRQGISSVEQIEAQNNYNKQTKEETEEEKNARKLRELEEAIRNGT